MAWSGRQQRRPRKRLNLACQQAGIPCRGVHVLWHSAETRMVRAGLALYDARHPRPSSIETTQTYAKWADDRLRHAQEGW